MGIVGRPKVELVLSNYERDERVRLTKRAHVNRAIAFRARIILASLRSDQFGSRRTTSHNELDCLQVA